MSETQHSKVLILGSGPAGLTAAIYTARAMLKPTLIAGMQPGGQMTITTDVENYPGFPEVIQGPWLMEQMQKQAENVGTRFVQDTVTEIDFDQRPFVAKCDSGAVHTADALIISTGARARLLGLPGEDDYMGFGVSACATCDGFFFRDKEVAVVGGGNTAVEEALYLTNHASKVWLIHRRDELRAEKILQERLFKHPKIEVIWNHTVERYVGAGDPKVLEGVVLRNTQTDETAEMKLDGLFIAIGHKPATELFEGKLEMDEGGYLITAPDSTRTNVPGVFAAGDVQDHTYRQAVTAAGTGCMAALEAERYLAAQEG